MLPVVVSLGMLLVGVAAVACGGSREPWAYERDAPQSSRGVGGKSGSSSAGASGVGAAGQQLPGAGTNAGQTDAGISSVAVCSGLGADIVTAYDSDFSENSGLRGQSVAVGAAVTNRFLSEKGYADTVAREFGLLTPENELKWNVTESMPGVFDFAAGDALVKFAERNQMHVRGHTLLWHSQLPDWVTQLTGAEAMRSAMRRHIESVMTHYRDQFPGRVVAWDVVNEALESAMDGSVSYRNSPFYRELGAAFIEEAFAFAREIDPKVKLYYNDFGIEGLSPKSTATFEMLRDLRQRGVPLDGVGFQMHTRAEDRGPLLADFAANLARYAEIGLPVNISEMDVSLCDTPGSLAERLDRQRLRYNRIAAACVASGICQSITVWGVHDSSSWINNRDAPCGDGTTGPRPLLFDDKYTRKPAWAGLNDALLGCYY